MKYVLLLSIAIPFVLSQTYDLESYEPVVCNSTISSNETENTNLPPITFRSAFEQYFDGKWSYETQIGVSGGGWNKVHTELTSRSLEDGDTFILRGSRLQVGVGLCVETCDLESAYGIRWKYNCVGFYGDVPWKIHAADENNEEYLIDSSNPQSVVQGFTYDKANNCITHVESFDGNCTSLPDHFKNQTVRAIGQVWNNAEADIVRVGDYDYDYWDCDFLRLVGRIIVWIIRSLVFLITQYIVHVE